MQLLNCIPGSICILPNTPNTSPLQIGLKASVSLSAIFKKSKTITKTQEKNFKSIKKFKKLNKQKI